MKLIFSVPVYDVLQALMGGTLNLVDILLVLSCVLRCTTSVTFSVSSAFVTLNIEHGCSHLERSHLLSSIGKHGWALVHGVFAVEDIVADVLQQKNWHNRYSPRTQNANRRLLHGKTAGLQKLTERSDGIVCYFTYYWRHYDCSRRQHTSSIQPTSCQHVYKSLQSEVTVSFAILRTTGVVTIAFDACTSPLHIPSSASSVTDKNWALVWHLSLRITHKWTL